MALRGGDPPLVARVQKGAVLLDLRTVPEECDAELLDALGKVCHDRIGAGAGRGTGQDGEGLRDVGGKV
jgi:hypothetical protein